MSTKIIARNLTELETLIENGSTIDEIAKNFAKDELVILVLLLRENLIMTQIALQQTLKNELKLIPNAN